jgi:hypothetical protein
MKMKVKVAELKAAIVKHQKADEARFVKESAEYKANVAFNNKLYIQNVATYLKELRQQGKRIEGYKIGEYLSRGFKREQEPKKAAHYGDLLVKLDLCVSDVVTVDDQSEYMRFLSGKCVC